MREIAVERRIKDLIELVNICRCGDVFKWLVLGSSDGYIEHGNEN
jgi:hypothetical protein